MRTIATIALAAAIGFAAGCGTELRTGLGANDAGPGGAASGGAGGTVGAGGADA